MGREHAGFRLRDRRRQNTAHAWIGGKHLNLLGCGNTMHWEVSSSTREWGRSVSEIDAGDLDKQRKRRGVQSEGKQRHVTEEERLLD